MKTQLAGWTIKLRIFRNNCLIVRNNLLIRYHLFRAERCLIEKYGYNWRHILNDECTQWLKTFNDFRSGK